MKSKRNSYINLLQEPIVGVVRDQVKRSSTYYALIKSPTTPTYEIDSILIQENTVLSHTYILRSAQGWEVIENHCQVCQKVASGDLHDHTDGIELRIDNIYIQQNINIRS